KLTLDILDSKGQTVRSFEGALPNAGRGRGAGGGERGNAAGRAGVAGAADAAGAASVGGAATAEQAAAGRGGNELPPEEEEGRGRGGPVTANIAAGLNRFTWDLQYQPVISFPGMVLWGATT